MKGIGCKICLNNEAYKIPAQAWFDTINDELIHDPNNLVILGKYSQKTNTYYEYCGCYLNGCENPKCYYTGNNVFLNQSFEALREETLMRHQLILSQDWVLIIKRTCDI
jgi:hypothetical protein